jgi:hypothetical protein
VVGDHPLAAHWQSADKSPVNARQCVQPNATGSYILTETLPVYLPCKIANFWLERLSSQFHATALNRNDLQKTVNLHSTE